MDELQSVEYNKGGNNKRILKRLENLSSQLSPNQSIDLSPITTNPKELYNQIETCESFVELFGEINCTHFQVVTETKIGWSEAKIVIFQNTPKGFNLFKNLLKGWREIMLFPNSRRLDYSKIEIIPLASI